MTDIEYGGSATYNRRISLGFDDVSGGIKHKLLPTLGFSLGISSFGGNPCQEVWPTGAWVVSWRLEYLGGSVYDPEIYVSSSASIGIHDSWPPYMGIHSFSFSALGPDGAQGVGQSVGAGINVSNSHPSEYFWVKICVVELSTCVPIGVRDLGVTFPGALTFNGNASRRIPHKFIRVGPERLGKAIRIDSANLGKIIRI